MSYIEVPEGENGQNHCGGGPAFAVRAAENEGRVRVLGQGALHGFQQLIKLLRARLNTHNHTHSFSMQPVKLKVKERTLSLSYFSTMIPFSHIKLNLNSLFLVPIEPITNNDNQSNS